MESAQADFARVAATFGRQAILGIINADLVLNQQAVIGDSKTAAKMIESKTLAIFDILAKLQ
ncbi:hypothetical protein [Pseudanabaena sp. PCC 6802]|uniref:hypothetical protein n=1 Tax=Pseudanabaena sp. PCC 6802 TaxID=118173 RepID=UPI00034D7004|nr:hypothetical protein [Pseudanabaena sp. PCC 6802]